MPIDFRSQGMVASLRYRERDLGVVPSSTVVGHQYYENRSTGTIVEAGDQKNNNFGLVPETEYTWDYLNPGPPFHQGGTFLTKKLRRGQGPNGGGTFSGSTYSGNKTTPNVGSGYLWTFKYSGAFCLPNWQGYTDGFFPVAYKATDMNHFSSIHPDDLSSLGTRAYNALRPKPEGAGLGQFVAEFRDTPRMLKTSAKGFSDLYRELGGDVRARLLAPSKVADHFLNHQFGWRPFVRDCSELFDTAVNFPDHFERIKRSNGQWVHRSFSEVSQDTETLIYSGGQTATNLPCSPGLSTQYSLRNGMIQPGTIFQTIKRKTYTRVWYKGLFRYFYPEFEQTIDTNSFASLTAARQFLTASGANISPTLLYKVTPWTWLIDWYANVGGTLQRFEDMATDRVVSKYFYLMRGIEDVLENRITALTRDGQNIDLTWTMGWTTKFRTPAGSNFGFSAAPGGLTGTQLAILAALGLNR